MRWLFDDLKLTLEPAGAAATAALLGPLRERLAGRRVGVLVCGSNIDLVSFARLAEADARAGWRRWRTCDEAWSTMGTGWSGGSIRGPVASRPIS